MRLVTFSMDGGLPGPGVFLPEGIFSLPYPNMLRLIQAGETGLDEVRTALGNAAAQDLIPHERVRLHAPLTHPASVRDFYAFEAHVRQANASRGREVPQAWYEMPVFYFSNHQAIYGPNETIPYPAYTEALDFELELACIIGKTGKNIHENQAEAYIFGYTIFNDWSARDIQRQEMSVGLGPAKGKDFATSLGPWIVTPDELQICATGRSGVYDLSMQARINGQPRSTGNFKDIYYSMGALISRASEEVWLYPGDVIASGTVGSGCLLELTAGNGPWLQPGDVVELEISQLGVLHNPIGKR
jgi:fumarylacetoacetate (FAA) hydrolase